MILTKKIKPRTSDFDIYDKIKLHSLLDMFQDMAGDHAKILGLGYDQFKPRNLAWVLITTKIDILKDIPYDSEVILSTWPLEKGRVDFIRDYSVSSPDGELYAIGSSKWVVIDYNTRRILRAKDIDYPGEYLNDKNYSEVEKLRIEIPSDKEYVCSHIVSNNDLDHNGHMNNCKYMEFIYNTINIKDGKQLISMHMDFINEAMLGDKLDLYKFNYENELYYTGYVNDKQSFIAKIKEK